MTTEGTTNILDIKWNFSKINIPTAQSKVYKDECVLSYDTPKSEHGINVCLNTFLSFSSHFTKLYHQKTGNNIFLNIKQIPIHKNVDNKKKQQEEEDVNENKPKKLKIDESSNNNDNGTVEYEQLLSLVCLDPIHKVIPLPNNDIPEKVKMAVEAIIKSESVERKEDLSAWEASPAQPSPHAKNLVQVGSVKIPPHGWKCQHCDKTENLWLCLTCGEISCGRKFWDGTGGNNHGVEHYQATRHPLVVKLGTIESGGEKADVYSYPEDEMVLDEHLIRHLEYFGINVVEMKKTEKTMAELELDQNLSFDFSRIQESDKVLQPLFGPGFTGLRNLGNSCYLASVMQSLFSIEEFGQRFLDRDMQIFMESGRDVLTVDDVELQTRKLANGLLSGNYSLPIDSVTGGDENSRYQEGIGPKSFKQTVGKNHPEFSTMRQQDAMEFFQHLMSLYERNQLTNPNVKHLSDPSQLFKFKTEQRTECSESHQVKYMYNSDNILSVPVPLEQAINREEYEQYVAREKQREKEKKENGATGTTSNNINDKPIDQKESKESVVRPRVLMKACVDALGQPEAIEGFYSSALGRRTTAIQTNKLSTFPDYLVVQVRRFILDGWALKKLDVFVEEPQEIDISHLRAHGLQPNEVELPEEKEPAKEQGAAQLPTFDQSIVSAIMEMGFPELHAQKAAINTNNAGVEQAMNWIFEHSTDADIDQPLEQPSSNDAKKGTSSVNEDLVEMITSMGIERDHAILALKNTDNNVERAIDWVFSHMDEIPALLAAEQNQSLAATATATSQATSAPQEPAYTDGSGKYELFAFVSHIGTSTNCGHYVAHIKKQVGDESHWVMFNDSKVAKSEEPPFDMGYLYFYKRKQ